MERKKSLRCICLVLIKSSNKGGIHVNHSEADP